MPLLEKSSFPSMKLKRMLLIPPSMETVLNEMLTEPLYLETVLSLPRIQPSILNSNNHNPSNPLNKTNPPHQRKIHKTEHSNQNHQYQAVNRKESKNSQSLKAQRRLHLILMNTDCTCTWRDKNTLCTIPTM